MFLCLCGSCRLSAGMVAHLGFLADKTVWLMGIKEVNGTFEVIEQERSHICRKTLFDENALYDDIFSVRWQRIGWNQPATGSQMICQIVQRVFCIGAFFEAPGHSRDTVLFSAAVDHIERTDLLQAVCQHLGGVVTVGMDALVTFLA